MVRNQNEDNDDTTPFLSWMDTLYPTLGIGLDIDRRRNPLYAVYHEIIACSDDGGVGNRDDGMPLMAVQDVAVDDLDDVNNEIEMGECNSSSTTTNFGERGNRRTQEHQQEHGQEQEQLQFRQRHQQGNDISLSPPSHVMTRPQPWRHSNTIGLILGFILSFVAFAVTLTFELYSILAYIPAVLYHFLAHGLFGGVPFLVVFRDICLILSASQMFTDSMLVFASVLVTELLGAIARLLCTLVGGSQSGNEWHMFIRRTCHLTRWGVRSCLTAGFKPRRIFLVSESDELSTMMRRPSRRQTVTTSSSSRTDNRVEDVEMDISSDTLSSRDPMGDDPNRNPPDSESTHHNSTYTDNPNVPLKTSTHQMAVTFAEELPTVTVAPEC